MRSTVELINYLKDGVDRGLWDTTPKVTSGSPILSKSEIKTIIEALELKVQS